MELNKIYNEDCLSGLKKIVEERLETERLLMSQIELFQIKFDYGNENSRKC